jgi:hypothetical protein
MYISARILRRTITTKSGIMECPVCLEFKPVVTVLHVHNSAEVRGSGVVHFLCMDCFNEMESESPGINCPVCRAHCPRTACSVFSVPTLHDGVLGFKALVKLNGRYVMQYPVYEAPVTTVEDSIIQASALKELCGFFRAMSMLCSNTADRLHSLLPDREPAHGTAMAGDQPGVFLAQFGDIISLLRGMSE